MTLTGVLCGRCGHDYKFHRRQEKLYPCVSSTGNNFADFCKCKNFVASQSETQGENEMAKKEKKAKKVVAKSNGTMKSLKLYTALSSKIDTALQKKVDDKETTNHNAVVLQVLLKKDAAMDFGSLFEAVIKTERYGKKKITEESARSYVRGDLNSLEKLGCVKITEKEAVTAISA